MSRARSAAFLAAMAAATWASFTLDPLLLPALLGASLLAARQGRKGMAAFAAVSLSIHVAITAVLLPEGPGVAVGPVRVGLGGAWIGLVGGLRLACALAANLALLSHARPARLVDELRLPKGATALFAALVLGAQDVGRDFQRLVLARRLEGGWPRGMLGRAREGARLLPTLLVGAHGRAQARRDALRLAGHDTGAWFVPVVAVAALAAAGRMAFLALPNVALTFVVVFLGGLLFGPWRAAGGALMGMAVTDFLLTGLYAPGFVNAPAMALLALAGGALRGFDFAGAGRAQRTAGALFAASAGIAGTFAFSVCADAFTWLLVYADQPALLPRIVVAGLVFNVVPAFVNAALFAASVGPCQRAWRAFWAPARERPASPFTDAPARSNPG